ncbi:MAG: glycosyltransferase family 4 protein [Deltaproteobacteria bacterium]|nr:glycosyltransferase family 4 protein [Deltaproteobacteria bacterium]
MKILAIHNFYGSNAPSGENAVYEAERDLLRQHGHEVVEFTRHSDEIRTKGVLGAIQGALAVPWNPWMVRAVRREVERFRPDVVHAHNTFPLISPGVFYAIGQRCAKVLTLHNYRLFCPAAIPMREGRPCIDCLEGHTVIPSLVHGCYRGSRMATLPLAAGVALHRALGTWTDRVDAFIALSDFQRDVMVRAGLPAERVQVKPNFYPGNPQVVPWGDRGDHAVFVGRLSPEKGVEALVRAWGLWGAEAPELRIVGDGPLRGQLERLSAGKSICFLGQLSMDEAQAQIAQAKLLILPSECFEGFPMVVREAFAFGTPAAVSALGPLPSIVRHRNNGLLFAPADPESLLREVQSAWRTPGLLERLAHGARQSFEEAYTEKSNYEALMGIYAQAIAVNRRQKDVDERGD